MDNKPNDVDTNVIYPYRGHAYVFKDGTYGCAQLFRSSSPDPNQESARRCMMKQSDDIHLPINRQEGKL